MASLDPIWRLTVEQYHAMIEAGIIPSGSPVELVEGVLLQKTSKSIPPHRYSSYPSGARGGCARRLVR